MIEQLKVQLRDAGYSLTKPRLTVFSALQGKKPKTMHELVASLDNVIDRASVYRTVTLFESLGIINRIQHGWKYRIELTDAYTPHHHHITCSVCNRMVSFHESEVFEELINAAALDQGFVPKSHSLEIVGLCQKCSLEAALK
jgi:Fur family ferric uptake transcriptional regulator